MQDPLASFSDVIPPEAPGAARRGARATGEYDYLLQLGNHLTVAFEVLDERGVPILPPAGGSLGQRLRRTLHPDRPAFAAAFEHVLTTSESHVDTFDGLRVAMVRVVSARASGPAVVVVAEPADESSRAERYRAIEPLAAWLAQLVARPFGPADSRHHTEWHQISSFCRAVAEQSVLGSQTALVRVFVEALAIWDDLDVRGYAAELSGAFAQHVRLSGADGSLAPPLVDLAEVHENGALRRLTPVEKDRLGFRAPIVSIAAVRSGPAPPWVLAFIGDIPADTEPRLIALLGVLRDVLSAAHAIEASRLTWALLQCLVSDFESIEETVRKALHELTTATGRRASLTLTRRDGAVLVSVGPPPAARPSGAPAVVARVWVTASYELVLSLTPEPDSCGLVRDQRLLDVAASLFASWLGTVLPRLDAIGDRRGVGRTFRDLVSRQIALARQSASDLALVIVRSNGAAPADVQQWVRELRARLRASDIAVVLPTGEVGILLPETSADDAARVTERLQRVFQEQPRLTGLATGPAGVASLLEQGGDDAAALVAAAQSRAGSGDDAS